MKKEQKNHQDQTAARERQIRRLTKYENMMTEAGMLLDAGQINERLSKLISALEVYYQSPRWKKDFTDDEAGLLPKDLKRGVLSEDGIYHLLDRYEELSGSIHLH